MKAPDNPVAQESLRMTLEVEGDAGVKALSRLISAQEGQSVQRALDIIDQILLNIGNEKNNTDRKSLVISLCLVVQNVAVSSSCALQVLPNISLQLHRLLPVVRTECLHTLAQLISVIPYNNDTNQILDMIGSEAFNIWADAMEDGSASSGFVMDLSLLILSFPRSVQANGLEKVLCPLVCWYVLEKKMLRFITKQSRRSVSAKLLYVWYS